MRKIYLSLSPHIQKNPGCTLEGLKATEVRQARHQLTLRENRQRDNFTEVHGGWPNWPKFSEVEFAL